MRRRYLVVGEDRLYIAKASYKPGARFSTAEPLDNEASLVAAGHLRVLPARIRRTPKES